MQARLLRALLALSLAAIACKSKDVTPGGTECGADGSCPVGFTCDLGSNLCVPTSGGHDGGVPDAKPTIDAVAPAPPDARPVDAGIDAPGGAVPDTTITEKPAAFTNVTAIKINYTATVVGSTFQCKLDAAAYAACTPPFMQTLAPGSYTFDVFAVGPGGAVDPTPAEVKFTIDTTAPDTTITSAPTGTITDTSATLTFTSSETGSTFTCKLDDQAATPCVSGQMYTGLGTGDHTVTVFATDQAGNADPTPASATWTVVTAIPETFIDLHPDSQSTSTHAHLTFHSDKDNATFECSLDAQPFAACTTPKDYFDLAAGSHGFDVRAVTAAGTDPTPAIIRWNIDQSSITTTITGGAPGGISCANTTFTFGAPGDDLHYECSLDGAGFTACDAGGASYTNLDGAVGHTFAVHAINAAGDVGPTASQAFTIDVTPPMVAITAPMSQTLTNANVTLVFAAEDGATLTCAVDGGALTPCVSGTPIPGLHDGSHNVSVTAADKCLNHNTATVTWNVDATPPVVAITSPTPNQSVPSVGTIHYTVGDSTSVKCTLDSHPVDCDLSGLYQYAGLTSGTHTFTIQGTDAVGNVSNPASVTFTLDAEPPVVTSLVLSNPHGGVVDVTAHLSDTSPVLQIHCVIDHVDTVCGFGNNLTTTLTGLGGGVHIVEVYGVDSAGNSGLQRPLGTAPTPHAFATFTSRVQGRAILFSFDFSDISSPAHDAGLAGGPLEMMLANAVTSSQVWPNQTPRVVGFRWLGTPGMIGTGVNADACANALDAISIKLGGVGDCDDYSGFPWYSQFSDPSQLGAKLANADVLLVHSMKDVAEAYALGHDANWIPTLVAWMNKGGILIVLDGQHDQPPGYGQSGQPDVTYCSLCHCGDPGIASSTECSLDPKYPTIMNIAGVQAYGKIRPLDQARNEIPPETLHPYVVNQPEDPIVSGAGFSSFPIPGGAVVFTSREKYAIPVVHWSAFLLGPLGFPTAAHAINSAGVLDRPYPDAVRVDVQWFHDRTNSGQQSYLDPGSWIPGAKVVFEDENGDVQVVTTDGGGVAIASLTGGGNVTVAVQEAGIVRAPTFHLTSFMDVPPNIGLAAIIDPYREPNTDVQSADVSANSATSQPANTSFYMTVNECAHLDDQQLPQNYVPGSELNYDPINFTCRNQSQSVDIFAWGISDNDLTIGALPHYDNSDGYAIPEFSAWTAPSIVSTFTNPPANTSVGGYGVTYFDGDVHHNTVLRGPALFFFPTSEAPEDMVRHAFPAPPNLSRFQEDVFVRSSTEQGTAISGQSRSYGYNTPQSQTYNLNKLLPYIVNPSAVEGPAPRFSWQLSAGSTTTSSIIAGGVQFGWFDKQGNYDWRIIFPASGSTNSVTAPTLPPKLASFVPKTQNQTNGGAAITLLGYDIDDPLHQINTYRRFLDGNLVDARPLDVSPFNRGEPDFAGYPYTVYFPSNDLFPNSEASLSNPLLAESGIFRYTVFRAGGGGQGRPVSK